MNYILIDGSGHQGLLPLTYTRPVAEILIGIDTIRAKWEYYLEKSTSTQTEAYLAAMWPLVEMELNTYIDAGFLPTPNLAKIVKGLEAGQAVYFDETPIAYCLEQGQGLVEDQMDIIQYSFDDFIRIEHTWDIFTKNKEAIQQDFQRLTAGRSSQPLPDGCHAIDADRIFIEQGAQVLFSSLNAEDGPIYIGKDALIMEGSRIRGPFSLGEKSTVKMGAKIYSGTTIGPQCKVGGEVNNSVLFGFSNKGHDGFLGNSVLGEWCNIGADSNTSNLKNNYAEVRLWDYATEGFAKTGLQFCGTIMGDHSKCGINTMFNTGTVVGVSSNVFGTGFPRNFIPSYSWGGHTGLTTYQTRRALETARAMMGRRGLELSREEEDMLMHVFEITTVHRRD